MSTNRRRRLPDEPRVRDLEAGDVIQTATLQGARLAPVAVVVESTPIGAGEYQYLRTHPLGQPGAVTHYPQRADTRVTRIRRGGAR